MIDNIFVACVTLTMVWLLISLLKTNTNRNNYSGFIDGSSIRPFRGEEECYCPTCGCKCKNKEKK